MNTKRFPYVPLFLLMLILFFITLACKDSGIGIFYSLEVETKLGDYSLKNSISVGSLALLGSDFYIAAGSVYKRGVDLSDWTALAPPGDSYLSSELVNFKDGAYACFYSLDGKTSTLYKLTDTTWNPVQVEAENRRVTGIVATGEVLFVSVKNSDDTNYSLYQSADGVDFADTNLDVSTPLISGTYDGTNLWLVSYSSIIRGPVSGPLTELADTEKPEAKYGYGGIYYSQGLNTLFLSTTSIDSKGFVFAFQNGAWGVPSAQAGDRLTDFAEFTAITATGTTLTIILVGSKAGYYEMMFDGSVDINGLSPQKPTTSSYSTDINYHNTVLSDSSILKFFVYNNGTPAAADDDVIFACTSGQGLWRNQKKDSAGRAWSRE
ncbi:MAG: hypothetical protein AB1798_07865 [Spirochaetota bacterium]